MILACDVGGTKTNVALLEQDGARLTGVRLVSFPSREHASLSEIIAAFLGETRPTRRAAGVVDAAIADITPLLAPGDVIIDGGNSYYVDDLRRAKALADLGLYYVDVGTSGEVLGLERGYCQMIGGEPDVVALVEPIFAALAPSADSVAPTPGRTERAGTAGRGYLHCGPSGGDHQEKT